AGESIAGARLSVQVSNATTNGPAIWRTGTSWSESALTWNSGQPARSGTAAVGNFGAMGTGRVATPVSGVTGAGDVSFQLYAETDDGVQFASRESSTTANRPQLVLTVTTGG
ncbi:MAG: DNRLRE domain-containing protein, partial [Actinomycetota bacterium]|nr:DNRLRE domain-containing protein [Actinomycetota bacterium]